MNQRILGIDPGSRITGYGLIDVDGQHTRHVDNGCIETGVPEMPRRLQRIFTGLAGILAQYRPDQVAIEQVFMHRNADSALKLGHARGAAIVACMQSELEVHEYTPTQIKKAIVGRGAADKVQIQHMVRVLLGLPEVPQADAADALAVAICHAHYQQGLAHLDGARALRGSRLV